MKLDSLLEINPVLLALFATLFTWGVTALGAAMVFFFKSINKRVLNSMLGFAAGVMIAASFWSLLKPAIEMAEANGSIPWVPALVGFLAVAHSCCLLINYCPTCILDCLSTKQKGLKPPGNEVFCLFLPSHCIISLKGWPLVLPLAR